jgi:DNA transposition AAA+ family ATPase
MRNRRSSDGTAMSKSPENTFIETKEYRRFVEFCRACSRYRYIGLCYGAPGVGKTLSARRLAKWDDVEAHKHESHDAELDVLSHTNVVFYTPNVVNSPGQIERNIEKLRHKLKHFRIEVIARATEPRLKEASEREKKERDEFLRTRDWLAGKPERFEASRPTLGQINYERFLKEQKVGDPTTLVIVDEADRLKMAGLEQVRDIFDKGGIGLVLIGMPGLEKRLVRYPQLYSRVGFVHQFRPLADAETRSLLSSRRRTFPGVSLPEAGLADEEALAAVLRITGGNFRLLHRLLTQVGRIVEINGIDRITQQVVETARESLVIGVT